MIDKLKRIIKDPLRLALKLFVLLWIFLIIHILLKVTFDYWQPYVIPTPQLEALGNFIDSHIWLQKILSGIFYIFNSLVAILCGTQQWKYKNKKQFLIVLGILAVLYVLNETLYLDDYTVIVGCFIIPLVINYKRWPWILLTFGLSTIFLAASLWLEEFTNANNMNYIVRMFLQGDYYIMLMLNYISFNLIREKINKKKETQNNG